MSCKSSASQANLQQHGEEYQTFGLPEIKHNPNLNVSCLQLAYTWIFNCVNMDGHVNVHHTALVVILEVPVRTGALGWKGISEVVMQAALLLR